MSLIFDYGEKMTVYTSIGQKYLLEVYSLNPTAPSGSIAEGSQYGMLSVSVGKPRMLEESATMYADSATTGYYSDFSSPRTIKVEGSNIPTTAVVRNEVGITFKESGIYNSAIQQWQVMAPNSYSWKTSFMFFEIDFPYMIDGSSNTNINGNWQVAFKSTSNSLRATPGLLIKYYYELGD